MSASQSPPDYGRPPPAHHTPGTAAGTTTPRYRHDSHNFARSQPASQPASRPDSPFPLSDSFFEETIPQRPSPTPPPSFLDNILNPAEPHARSERTGLNWHPSSQRSRPRSPVLSTLSSLTHRPEVMAPNTRSNGFIDLTHEPSSPAGPIQPPRPLKRTVTQRLSTEAPAGPSCKRLKRDDGATDRTAAPGSWKAEEIEEIDLSDDKVPLQEALRKQRVEAVKAQEKPDEKPLKLSNLTCVICMDNPTDITATSCGHLFCHTCLMEALIAGENRASPGEAKRSQCPICRKFINRAKAADIIPLLMKKGLGTQPRKRKASRTPDVV